MYAIVDIETTGGLSGIHRITEVAVMVHNGHQIVGEFHTLVNPERAIPGFITGLTGINAEMVRKAPLFSEIASEVYALLADKIFVAHHVNFDYSFIKAEFRRVGLEFNRPKLCTVRLSRKVYPGLRSYSLGSICGHTGIIISDRHRAFGDAAATAQLFGNILSKDHTGIIEQTLKRSSGEAFLPPHISVEKFLGLPEKVGVYYFHDARGQVIYVGKALNIKSRFKGHFSSGSKSNQALRSEIHEVTYQLSGSDFLALLLEALEIKRLWPKYNRAQKAKTSSWGIYQYEDVRGYLRLQIAKIQHSYQPLHSFTTHGEAWTFLVKKIEEYDLCPKLCGIQKTPKACYAYQEQRCRGACCGAEKIASYNDKVHQMIQSLGQWSSKILIKEKGRELDEQAAILFEKGVLTAYGFIDDSMGYSGTEEVVSLLKQVKPIPETNHILRSYLARTRPNYLEL